MDYLLDVNGLSLRQISFDLFDVTLVLDFLDWLQMTHCYSASTWNHRLMVLRSFFRYAGTVDCAQIDIHMRLKKILPQTGPGKVIEYLSEDALRSLLDQPDIAKATDHRNQAFIIAVDAVFGCQDGSSSLISRINPGRRQILKRRKQIQ